MPMQRLNLSLNIAIPRTVSRLAGSLSFPSFTITTEFVTYATSLEGELVLEMKAGLTLNLTLKILDFYGLHKSSGP